MTESRSIGVFGGSFDPVHNGHIRAAELVLRALELDLVLFVPAAVQWQKDSQSSTADRLAMLQLALSGNPDFSVSTVDLDRGGNTYTVDTLTDLHALYPNDKLFFIIGADAMAGIDTWKEADRVLSLAQFVVITRPGTDLRVPAVAEGRCWYLEIPALNISSTDFREKYGSGAGYEGLVPSEVLTYIRENNLYSEGKGHD